MIKIQDNSLFQMFQAILRIDYLKCLKCWEGVGRVIQNFEWYKIAELSAISKKIPYLFCAVVTILSPPELSTPVVPPGFFTPGSFPPRVLT